MKLWYSFIKELQLTSKSIYFYIEVFMAVLILALLLFVIPENFTSTNTEFIYIDDNDQLQEHFTSLFLKDDTDGIFEITTFEIDAKTIEAKLYEDKDSQKYLTKTKKDMIALAKKERKFGAHISLNSNNQIEYTYYIQGYETQKLRNLYMLIHTKSIDLLEKTFNNQTIVNTNDTWEVLSDRDNVIPAMMTFNGSLMGLFIIGAYIFLDKKEGIINAYAVTASSITNYLLSKVGVLIVTSLISSFIILLPVLGLRPNYPLLIIFLIGSGFFSSALGLLIASFYENISEAFGIIYVLIVIFAVPVIAYFIPSWDPEWIKIIPSYLIINTYKEIILPNSNVVYVLSTTSLLSIIGFVLFFISAKRYKKTLRI